MYTNGGGRGKLRRHSQYIVSGVEYYIYIYYYELFRRMQGPTISLSKLTHGAGRRRGGVTGDAQSSCCI